MKHWTIKLAGMLILMMATLAQACPMCKDSVPNSDAQAAAGVPTGLNTSVYFMLTGLFSVMGLVSFVIVKGIRESDSRSVARGFPVDPDQKK